MSFNSILFKNSQDNSKDEMPEIPNFFVDLHLDRIIDAVTSGKAEYNLHPFFLQPLKDTDSIRYRQEIMHDLENETLLKSVNAFGEKMILVRQYLDSAGKIYYKYHKEGWFLEAVDSYCRAVSRLNRDLSGITLKSRGFLAFRRYLNDYVTSAGFVSLKSETKKLKGDLGTVKYCVLLKDGLIKVSSYESEIAYSVGIEETFAKFNQGPVKDYSVELKHQAGINHVEAEIISRVARLYPGIFSNLDNYYEENSVFLDKKINRFYREIQFYISYLEFLVKLKKAGLKFCYPKISHLSKEIYDYDGFDLALAAKCIAEKSSVICNDFFLKHDERIIIVSGPNQGGKTTFARTFGQLHYLASLGFPVPGTKARLFLYDRIFTHFEKEENIQNLRGKLQDDLMRIHDILNNVSTDSIIIINEIFSSTTLKDAVFLSRRIMNKIINMDLLCICVTFIVELASLNKKAVSMTAMVDPQNPVLRTYKIERRSADGLACAVSIAVKHRLTYDLLRERIKI